jgi:hypothetical protein
MTGRIGGSKTHGIPAVRSIERRRLNFAGGWMPRRIGQVIAGSSLSGPRQVLDESANPGLAASGSGDVLVGVLGSLMAKGLSAARTALLSV